MNATAKTFESVFKQHYKGLHAYAITVVKDRDAAEEIVQNLFCRLWEKNRDLAVDGPLSSYLYKSIYNASLNHVKHLKVRHAHQVYVMEQSTSEEQEHSELQEQLAKALEELPERCRTVFQLSRFEDLKYSEIAQRLLLPPKTVENEMGKALRMLRVKLVDFLVLILFICS